MPQNKRRPYLLSYDIGDPKRLLRIHRAVSEEGLALQYSVFYFYATAEEMQRMGEILENKIDPRRDDIRIYALPAKIQVDTLGKAPVASGVQVYGASLPLGFMGRKVSTEQLG